MVSILYALFLFVPIELMVNVYRISRLTGWELNSTNILNMVIICADIVFGTAILYLLTTKWLGRRKLNYLTIVFWVPYFILFVYIFARLFPITYGGDDPNPVTGLLAIGMLLLYPVYIFFMNLIHSLK
ncbi:hypothetical protein J42TS3_23850 [Paenibacillus vini]|uniref:Uncharacterized protein n=1 Tax=Paenibacillus vini TaxID=1476024 RepID=A0ABQ4MD42_9BACL|nr:hypothetical protein J42TS3_23850 [Paenibacillus vini]